MASAARWPAGAQKAHTGQRRGVSGEVGRIGRLTTASAGRKFGKIRIEMIEWGKRAIEKVRAAAVVAVWSGLALTVRSEVVSNCFSVVEYSEDCIHLACNLEMFAGVDFVLDRKQVNNPILVS